MPVILDSASITSAGSTKRPEYCPCCQAEIRSPMGERPWCDTCGWNLDIPALPKPHGILQKAHFFLSLRFGQRLYEDLLHGKSLEQKISLAQIIAYGIAGLTHSITLAGIGLGFWLAIFAFPHQRFLGLILGIACLALTFILIAPRFSKISGYPLPREQFPALYHLADQVADALGSPRVDDIRYDIVYNAGFAQAGWKRKRYLILGLPLMACLESQEIIALISHELVHGVNGDPSRAFFIETALQTLDGWYDLLTLEGLSSLFLIPVKLITLPFFALVWLLGNGLAYLLWYDNQRAEYLADLLASQVSGTEAQCGVLRKSNCYETFENCLKAAYLRQKGMEFFTKLKKDVGQASPRVVARIQYIEKQIGCSIYSTHPPAQYRAGLLAAYTVPSGKIILNAEQAETIQRELMPLYAAIQEKIFSWDEQTFRERFHLSW